MKIELFGGAFWGVLLILIGILFLIKHVFNIQFPVGRVIIAFLFIYIGIRMLIGYNFLSFRGNMGDAAAFSNSTFNYSPDRNNYSCVFGNYRLDLSDINITENKTIEISAVFSEFKVRVNKDSNLEIISSTAFGYTSLPNGNSNAFGELRYSSPGYNPTQPHLTIKTNVAFGELKFSTK